MQNVVFRWLACGGMRGKRGLRMDTFRRRKIRHVFHFLFFELEAMLQNVSRRHSKMRPFKKLCLFLALAAALLGVPGTSALGSSGRSPLQLKLEQVPGSSSSGFQITLHNDGDRDLVLNLGTMLGNGRKQFADAIHLSLANSEGGRFSLELRGPPIIGGRVDPMVVALPQGASLTLSLDLADYFAPKQGMWRVQLSPGRYTLKAEYIGQGFMQTPATPYWIGTVSSSELPFVVSKKLSKN
jgi:hypothetical protein